MSEVGVFDAIGKCLGSPVNIGATSSVIRGIDQSVNPTLVDCVSEGEWLLDTDIVSICGDYSPYLMLVYACRNRVLTGYLVCLRVDYLDIIPYREQCSQSSTHIQSSVSDRTRCCQWREEEYGLVRRQGRSSRTRVYVSNRLDRVR